LALAQMNERGQFSRVAASSFRGQVIPPSFDLR
jgi:hypothetical protein